MFNENGIKIVKNFTGELSHNLKEYIGHASQSKTDAQNIDELVNIGLDDSNLAKYFFYKGEEIYFKKSGIVIFGIKE